MSPCWTDSPPGSYTSAKIVASRSVPGLGSTPSRPPPAKTCALLDDPARRLRGALQQHDRVGPAVAVDVGGGRGLEPDVVVVVVRVLADVGGHLRGAILQG